MEVAFNKLWSLKLILFFKQINWWIWLFCPHLYKTYLDLLSKI